LDEPYVGIPAGVQAMAFEMKCNMCGLGIQLDESRAGSMINCPSCGQVIFVQQAAPNDIAPVEFDDPRFYGEVSIPRVEEQPLDVLPANVGSAGSRVEPFTAENFGPDTSSSLVELVAGGDSPGAVAPAPVQAPTQTPGMPPDSGSADGGEYRVARDLQAPDQADISARGDWYVGDVPVSRFDSDRRPQSAPVVTSVARRVPSNFAALAAAYMCGVVSGLIIGRFIFG